MPTLYTRATVLRSVGGRIHYITSPKRQEHLLGAYDGAEHLLGGRYWSTLAEESQRSFVRHGELHKDAVEGRELILKLSNALLDIQRPDEICRLIAESFEAKYHRPVIVALHYNKAESNLHAHIIFAEREILPEPEVKIAPRNLFYDEDGKRQYKKAKVLDDNGQLRPGCRIVAKGEVYERRSFGPAAPEFAMKTWMNNMKETWALPLLNGPLHGDMEYKLFDPSTGKLPQQHVGKNLQPGQAAAVREYNEMVREYNNRVDSGEISREDALMVRDRVVHAPRKAAALQQALEDLPAQEVDADQAVVVLVKRYSETLWTGYLEDLDGQLWIVDGVLSKPEERGIVEGATVRLSEGKYHLAEDWERQALQEALQGPEEPQEGYGGVQGYADFLKAKNGPEEPQESRGR